MKEDQVGGTHYKDFQISPLTYIMENQLPFCEGNVIKYVSRHARKNGAEDLLKAVDYINRILEREYGIGLDYSTYCSDCEDGSELMEDSPSKYSVTHDPYDITSPEGIQYHYHHLNNPFPTTEEDFYEICRAYQSAGQEGLISQQLLKDVLNVEFSPHYKVVTVVTEDGHGIIQFSIGNQTFELRTVCDGDEWPVDQCLQWWANQLQKALDKLAG